MAFFLQNISALFGKILEASFTIEFLNLTLVKVSFLLVNCCLLRGVDNIGVIIYENLICTLNVYSANSKHYNSAQSSLGDLGQEQNAQL